MQGVGLCTDTLLWVPGYAASGILALISPLYLAVLPIMAPVCSPSLLLAHLLQCLTCCMVACTLATSHRHIWAEGAGHLVGVMASQHMPLHQSRLT